MIPGVHPNTAVKRLAMVPLGVIFTTIFTLPPVNAAQNPAPQTPQGAPVSWVQAAAVNEEAIIKDDGDFPLRYRVRQVGAKGDMTREVIESKQGSVARKVENKGQPLTAAEDAAERERLNQILRSPNDFIEHHKRDESSRQYSLKLVSEMPKAMIFTYAPEQPQPENAKGLQIVIDFVHDPHYKPSCEICNALTGIQGRMWIDAKTQRLTRIEGQIIQEVDYGWGGWMAKIAKGGRVEFEQTNAGENRWVYSHLDEHLAMRVLLVKAINENNLMTASDFRLLPAPLSVQEAVHTLLDMQIPLKK